MNFYTLALLALAAFTAGFFDAAVGGGGLITIPSLTAALPLTVPFPTILGTNKVLACGGNTVAALRFARSGIFNWREPLKTALFAAGGACGGVALAYRVHSEFMRPLTLGLLLLMLGFTLFAPHLGRHAGAALPPTTRQWRAALLATGLGFYDGFFGPGTGTLLVFSFITVLRLDFLQASAWAKIVNLASQLTSVILFLSQGNWIPELALSMAVANAAGGYWGARTAIRFGTQAIRWLFITVVVALITRLGWQVVFA